MDLSLSTPALLFPAIAILMLGYINRYVAVANVIRTFKKDYDAGYVHAKIVKQLTILKKRIELLRYALSLNALALVCACLSMFLIFAGYQRSGEISFGTSLILMILSLTLSAYETSLSNTSLLVEINDIFKHEENKKK